MEATLQFMPVHRNNLPVLANNSTDMDIYNIAELLNLLKYDRLIYNQKMNSIRYDRFSNILMDRKRY